MQRLDLAERRRSTSTASTASSISPRRPGVRSFGDVFPIVRAPQPARDAARLRGVRAAPASGSSSPRRRRCTARPRHIRRRRTTEPRPISPYGITKLGCEQLARAYAAAFGLDAVVLRYFTVYGPRQRPGHVLPPRLRGAALAAARSRSSARGEQSRSFTYVDDAVAATIAAMERAERGAVFNVGGGEEATMLEAIALLERLSGRTLDVRHVGAAKGDVSRTSADVARIREALGWQPRDEPRGRSRKDVVMGLS